MGINVAEVKERIDQLEQELDELRAQLQSEENPKSYRDLYGSMKGMLNATDELLAECEFKIEWDSIDPDGEAA